MKIVFRDALSHTSEGEEWLLPDSSLLTKRQPVFLPEFAPSFEAALAVSKCDVEKQVFVINLPNYNFRKDEDKWLERAASLFDGRKKDYEESMTKLSDPVKGPHKDKLRKIITIIGNLGGLWKMLESKNSGDFQELSKNSFEFVCNELKRSLEETVYKNENITNSKAEPVVLSRIKSEYERP